MPKESGISRRTALAATGAALSLPPPAHSLAGKRRTVLGLANDSLPSWRGSGTHEYIGLVNSLGMAVLQAPLTSLEPAYARQTRTLLEANGLGFVLSASFHDMDRFRREASLAKEAGALAIRVPSGGRRYEDFSSLDARRAHVGEVHASIRAALVIAEAARIPIALENHKDFTADELVALFQSYSSKYLGACIDTGNNLALLEDPNEVIGKLAPFGVVAHFKDATLEEYREGFLLGDIPLGEGCLDLKQMLATLRQSRPNLPLLLECIPRNPLRIPCLTDSYWVTFPERNGRDLARALRLVRASTPKWQIELPRAASPERLREVETMCIEASIKYARDALGLV